MNARLDLDALPWSCEAEQSVLGALLLDPRAWAKVRDVLQPSDFFDARHGLVFAEVGKLAAAGLPVDVITVLERLQAVGQAEAAGGAVYLNQLAQSVPSAANIGRYAEIVREKASQRALLNAADQALTIAGSAGTVAEKLDQMMGLLAPLERQQTRQTPKTMAQIANERINHYEALQAGRAQAGWPTRLPGLDRRLNGGLRPGGLYILAARPSVGKSSLSQAIGTALARDGRPTLLLSQEMADSELGDRAVANAGRINYEALLSGRMDDGDWGRAVDALEALAPLPLYVDDQGGLTLRDIKAKARSVPGLKVLVIDYIQLCASDQRDANRNAQLEQLSRGLKAFAKEEGIAIIALSQLNREVESRPDKRPRLSDLRDSGAIEQDADVVMFLWPVRELGDSRIVGLGVDKNRQGRTGETALEFFGATQEWHESDADLRPPVARQAGGFK